MTETVKVDPPASLGSSFAAALAAKDFDQIRALLHPEIDFHALRVCPETPAHVWRRRTHFAGRRPQSAKWLCHSASLRPTPARSATGQSHTRVSGQALTPRKNWEASDPDTLCAGYRPIEEV